MREEKDIFGIEGMEDNIDTRYKDLEVEGDFLSSGERQTSLRKSISQAKIRWLFICIALVFAIVFLKIIDLQIVHGEEYKNRAENNRIKVETKKALRGVIYDRDDAILVKNSPNFTLYFTPSELPPDQEYRKVVQEISQILNLDSEEVFQKVKSSNHLSNLPVVIKEYIDYEQALRLRILIEDFAFLSLETLAIRQYLPGLAFSHILGYMGKVTQEELDQNEEYTPIDYLGKTGLEKYYENTLKGEDGKQQVERDNLNKVKRVIATKEPIAGQNLVLAVDSGLQDVLYEALENSVKNNGSKGGAAVAIDPRNGEILALVSYPSFDNNLFFKGISSDEYQKITEDERYPLISRPISGEYPPGSTIKPTVAAAALEEKIITPSTTVMSTGGIQIDKWYFPDWKAGGHGATNVVKAIAESVNTFFYAISGGYENINGLGLDNMNYYFRKFGLSEKLGIDLPSEAGGFLPSKEWKEKTKNEKWYIGDTYHIAIGQGDILVTPLQVASYTAAIANNGTLYHPHLVKKFTDLENKVTLEIQPEVIRQNFVKSQNLEIVRRGLREAVLSGSARSMSDLPFPVAGKTGTAQYAANKKTHAWFTCFAPYENPEIVITVLVEGGGEGHIAALPVAKEGLVEYFKK